MSSFKIAADGVCPSTIPHKKLNNGMAMPGIGIGTFGSDSFSGEQVANGVREAVSLGFRLIDCGACYGNEALIGEVFKEILASGEIKREELFIQ